jgi:hypothetical protein
VTFGLADLSSTNPVLQIQAFTATVTNFFDSTAPFYVGAITLGASQNIFKGVIDELRLSRVALTGSQLLFPTPLPVARSIIMGAQSGVPTTIRIIGGKHAPTNAGDNPLIVKSVGLAGNGTATTDGTNVTYTSTGDYVGTNSFTYTVSDGFGGTDTKTVTVIVRANGEGFNQLAPPVPIGGGQVMLSYLGIPGTSYSLDWTTNLTPPVIWTALATNTAATNGMLTFTNSSVAPVNFFRTRHLP